MTVIETRNVSKIFGPSPVDVRVLTDISLSFSQGELIIIKGPSGSGKTTLLSILGCLLSPTSGEVALFGENIIGLSKKELRNLRLEKIGFIFQDFNLMSALTAKENVALVRRLRGVPQSQGSKEAETLLAGVDLADRLDFPIKNLSQGEKQRVAIARAFANNPAIILADEPTASLDSKTGQRIISMLRDLGRDKTVIVATHDERMAELADRVVVLEDGRTAGTSQDSRRGAGKE